MKTTKEQREQLRDKICSLPNPEYIVVSSANIKLLLDDIDTLKAALEQVEWVADEYTWCPWCNEMHLVPPKHLEHKPDCPRQLALREGE